jgi:mannose-6-phosphate isomerase-like protein (cupin superfamily)
MATLLKFSEVPGSSPMFGAAVYRQFFDTDGLGPVGEDVHKRGSSRYEEGYSVARICESKPSRGRRSIETQPEHYHPERYPFIIIGIAGRRVMLVGGDTFTIGPGTLLQIGKGEHHRTLNWGEAFVTLELWKSGPHDDEILITEKGEESVMERVSAPNRRHP